MSHQRKSVCYFCGKPSTSKEHVPPRMFFRGCSCDRITVPSCEAHNSHKSGDDQAIISALLLSLRNLRSTDYSNIILSLKTEVAINLAESAFQTTKNRVKNVPITENSQINVDYLQVAHVYANIDLWIKQLTAAFVYDAISNYEDSIDWEKSLFLCPNWIPSSLSKPLPIERIVESDITKKIKELDTKVNWIVGWSAYPKKYPPEIYRFYFSADKENNVIIKHTFYENYRFYVLFNANEKIIEGIYNRAKLYTALTAKS